jgi:hypothetical protein
LLSDFLRKNCRTIPNPATSFTDDLISKKEWASVLGVDRKSLQRWESQIILVCDSYRGRYFYGESRGCMLDGYRKFLLSLIAELKKLKKNNEQVVQYLNQNEAILTRRNFTNWRKDYEAQRPI